jgi:hypothetical protein
MNTIKDIAEEMVDLWYTNDVGDGNRVQRAERRKLAERIAEALQEQREKDAKIALTYDKSYEPFVPAPQKVARDIASQIREGGA